MTPDRPNNDDLLRWDLHLSGLTLPALTAADEPGVFDELASAPASAQELAVVT